ncbi:hypothetical protein Q8A67_013329 [Cirrhinus molitorella]|uniref:Uncharacterized protein n=1 Tax=Cirrhinus molitorella TaxID=172907 RepID=A0AA88PWW8_9TELE|nr:hypothetical protein Q8A67_013329 [Cirrhinus molitorella]
MHQHTPPSSTLPQLLSDAVARRVSLDRAELRTHFRPAGPRTPETLTEKRKMPVTVWSISSVSKGLE